jgi:hypothetical protein
MRARALYAALGVKERERERNNMNKEEQEIERLKSEIKGLQRVIRDLVDLLKEKHVRPREIERLEKKVIKG